MTGTVSLRTSEISDHLNRWLKRRSAPATFAGDAEAERDEIMDLMSALLRFAPQAGAGAWTDRVLSHVADTLKVRTWPTKAEVIEACRMMDDHVASSGAHITRGDRATLSRDQLHKLETEIIPTARRWLSIPGLASKGRATLDFWGEK